MSRLGAIGRWVGTWCCLGFGDGGAGTHAPRPASTLCEVCSYARGHHRAGDVPNTAARHVVVYGSYEEREHLV